MYDNIVIMVVDRLVLEFGDKMIESFCSLIAKKSSEFQNAMRNIGVRYSASI